MHGSHTVMLFQYSLPFWVFFASSWGLDIHYQGRCQAMPAPRSGHFHCHCHCHFHGVVVATAASESANA